MVAVKKDDSWFAVYTRICIKREYKSSFAMTMTLYIYNTLYYTSKDNTWEMRGLYHCCSFNHSNVWFTYGQTD